jgi:hypothetical protein
MKLLAIPTSCSKQATTDGATGKLDPNVMLYSDLAEHTREHTLA